MQYFFGKMLLKAGRAIPFYLIDMNAFLFPNTLFACLRFTTETLFFVVALENMY